MSNDENESEFERWQRTTQAAENRKALYKLLRTVSLTLAAFGAAVFFNAPTFIKWLIFAGGSAVYAEDFIWTSLDKKFGGSFKQWDPEATELILLKELVEYARWTCVFAWCGVLGVLFLLLKGAF